MEDEFAVDILKDEETEFIIGVDRGLLFLYEHNILPDYIVGDFDSAPEEVIAYYKEETKVPIREFNPVKDASDTEIALRLCLDLHRQNILILGATGTRLDHVLGNLYNLLLPLQAGVPCRMVDSHNKIFLLDQTAELVKEEAFGKYVSFLPLTETVEGVTLTGFKYPLNNYLMKKGQNIGISNEFQEDRATVAFRSGILICVQSRD